MFGEDVFNTLQDIVLTMFRDALTDARMQARTNRTTAVRTATLRWAEA